MHHGNVSNDLHDYCRASNVLDATIAMAVPVGTGGARVRRPQV